MPPIWASIPSRVRTAKITTIEGLAATPIGRLDAPTWHAVLDEIAEAFASRR